MSSWRYVNGRDRRRADWYGGDTRNCLHCTAAISGVCLSWISRALSCMKPVTSFTAVNQLYSQSDRQPVRFAVQHLVSLLK